MSILDFRHPDIDRPISDIQIGEQHGLSISLGPAFARGASPRRTPLFSSAINVEFCTGYYDRRRLGVRPRLLWPFRWAPHAAIVAFCSAS